MHRKYLRKNFKSAGRRKLENQRLTATFSTAFFALFLALVPRSASAAEPLAKITIFEQYEQAANIVADTKIQSTHETNK